jgi:redox-sensitive bicupin YhaK (pirin superfamily)
MENIIIHKADERGHADHGWLNAHHTFSFAGYHNPDAVHFGVLRVLNDDVVAPAMGFGTHPHDNMEIITIPLKGALAHKDSMGNEEVIRSGDVQVMSAGTGVRHSEYNASKREAVNLLQIWLFPDKRNVQPRYGQITLDTTQRHNKLQQILSPNADDEGVWIHQNAWFHMGNLDKDFATTYSLKAPATNGVYAFIIKGDVTINGNALHSRDGMGISGAEALSIKADSDAEILLMELPMALPKM